MVNLFKKKLPHCDELFAKYLAPWYPDEYYRKMTRPDLYTISGFDGKPLDLDALQYLAGDNLVKEKNQIERMKAAALGDYNESILQGDDFTIDLLTAVDVFYDREKIGELIRKSNPREFGNDYLVAVGEFGTMLGALFEKQPGFGWLYSAPYFNSIIVHKNTGLGITVYDWAVKKFSEYGVDDGFAAKFGAALRAAAEEEKRI